jgi:hypothetical protein
MRAKDVAKEHDWGSRLEVRECAADLAADTDIPVVVTMLSGALGKGLAEETEPKPRQDTQVTSQHAALC